ncbi:MAG: hypothetical protein QF577_07865 [Phycisphaerae bacterium]|jgi:hypothetical protein|nr:hypothetical protein [Phycisphaerae bacterium]MDP7637449.1 hypothetical protein [Phycisphaerae bacterium]
MATYSVIAVDGQTYGPVDEEGLLAWVKADRVVANTNVHCHETNQMVPACTLPFLGEKFAPAPPPAYPAVTAGASGNMLASYPEIVPANSPAARMHTLSRFPGAAVVLLHFVTLGIFTIIWFNLMHGKMPKTRHGDPSAGKAIGFLFIPFFNLYWSFFTSLRLVDRVNQQRLARGLPSTMRGFTLTVCILSIIPYVNYVNFLIIWPIWTGLMQGSVNELVAATAQALALPRG